MKLCRTPHAFVASCALVLTMLSVTLLSSRSAASTHRHVDAGSRSADRFQTIGAECEADFVHGLTGSGITGLGNWSLHAMKVWDDGNGPAVYIAGRFDTVNGVAATNIAKFDGTTWSPLGNGVGQSGTAQTVHALEVFDDGDGEKLYVGGSFVHASDVPGTARIAKWDGTQWLAGGTEGTTMNGPVYAFAVGNIGSGERIFAAGSGGISTRVWHSDGGTFTSYLTTFSNGSRIWAMQVYNYNGAPHLFVGGEFTSVQGVTGARNIVRFNGTEWQNTGATDEFGHVRSMTVHDDGDGPALYIGGRFTIAGNNNIGANRIARFKAVNGIGTWSGLGSGMTGWSGCSTCIINVFGLASFDDGTGPALFAVGNYTLAGGVAATSIAKWQDNQWHAISNSVPTGGHGSTVPHYHTLAVHDSCGPLTPSGEPALFIAGHFTSISGEDSRYVTMYQACPEDTNECQSISADLNCDDVVNVSDLLILLGAWGTCPICGCPADLNGDATVNVSDLLILLANWG